MVEDGRSDPSVVDDEPPEDMNRIERSRGSGVIFALVAIALILAIGFFYLTKERESGPDTAVTEATESVDSAATVVGDAAQKAADELRNQN